jgi:hypothetical protein
VRRTERNLLRRVADRQILIIELSIHRLALEDFAAGGRCFLRKNRIVAAEDRTLGQYGTTLAATNNGGTS